MRESRTEWTGEETEDVMELLVSKKNVNLINVL